MIMIIQCILVIDKPVLDLVKITEETQLEIESMDGKSLNIKPITARPSLKKPLVNINKKFNKTLKNLAK